MKPRVLIGCETSGTMKHAFALQGWDAWSCDVLPDDDGDTEFHMQCDVHDAMRAGHWDLMILHPPCTALAVSGNGTYAKGKPKHHERLQAMQWTEDLWLTAKILCDHVCMENPAGVLKHTLCGKASQYVQPYEHGHGETKKTGFWLHNLPLITPTDEVEGRDQRVWNMAPSPTRWKERSKTYAGIAKACAEQWTAHMRTLGFFRNKQENAA